MMLMILVDWYISIIQQRGLNLKYFSDLKTDAQGHITSATQMANFPFAGNDPNPPGNALMTNDNLVIQVEGTDNIEINFGNITGADYDKSVFANLTHFNMGSDIKATVSTGRSAGIIKKFSISANGEVKGSYTNGESEALARIGLATFDNPSGLLQEGGNLFSATSNSGTPKYGQPGAGSFGKLTPGAYEMSNVDLSVEFTDMITTQRGFQANSRVVTTSDEILQELVNLKR